MGWVSESERNEVAVWLPELMAQCGGEAQRYNWFGFRCTCCHSGFRNRRIISKSRICSFDLR